MCTNWYVKLMNKQSRKDVIGSKQYFKVKFPRKKIYIYMYIYIYNKNKSKSKLVVQ